MVGSNFIRKRQVSLENPGVLRPVSYGRPDSFAGLTPFVNQAEIVKFMLTSMKRQDILGRVNAYCINKYFYGPSEANTIVSIQFYYI